MSQVLRKVQHEKFLRWPSQQAVSKRPRLDTTIIFSDSDMEGCQHTHDNPLVIRVVVTNKTIHKVLVDNGSSTDIIFASAFNKMGIGREKLEPVNAYLCGFSGERVLPLGSIQLVLTLGDPPCQATTTVRFLRVDAPSAYNMLLGKPSKTRENSNFLKKGKMVISVKIRNFSRSRMMKRTSPLESSREI